MVSAWHTHTHKLVGKNNSHSQCSMPDKTKSQNACHDENWDWNQIIYSSEQLLERKWGARPAKQLWNTPGRAIPSAFASALRRPDGVAPYYSFAVATLSGDALCFAKCKKKREPNADALPRRARCDPGLRKKMFLGTHVCLSWTTTANWKFFSSRKNPHLKQNIGSGLPWSRTKSICASLTGKAIEQACFQCWSRKAIVQACFQCWSRKAIVQACFQCWSSKAIEQACFQCWSRNIRLTPPWSYTESRLANWTYFFSPKNYPQQNRWI